MPTHMKSDFITASPLAVPELSLPAIPDQSSRIWVGLGNATTPQRLATFWGQFFVHRSQALFRLDDSALTIQPLGLFADPPPLRLPLDTILEVSVSRYPFIANFLGLDYVKITANKEGLKQEVIFTPNPGFWATLSDINANVSAWSRAITEARNGQGPSLASNTYPRRSLFFGLWVFLFFALLLGIIDLSLGWPFHGVPAFCFGCGAFFLAILMFLRQGRIDAFLRARDEGRA